MTFDQDKRDEDTAFAREAVVLIDSRLADLWGALWTSGEAALGHDAIGRLIRLAYLSGYQDALTEAVRGQLFEEVGIPVPKRATPAGQAPGG